MIQLAIHCVQAPEFRAKYVLQEVQSFAPVPEQKLQCVPSLQVVVQSIPPLPAIHLTHYLPTLLAANPVTQSLQFVPPAAASHCLHTFILLGSR